MKITCGKCEKEYKIDESKLRKDKTGLICKACGDTIWVTKPGFTAPVEPAPVEPAPAESTPVAPAAETPKPAVALKDMETQKIRFGLLRKVILAMLVVGIVPFGIFLGMTFKETRERIRTDTELLMAQTADGLGRHVDEWIDKNVRMLKVAAQLSDMTSMNPAAQEKVLKSIRAEYPFMYLVFTLDANGINIARSDGKKLKAYSDRQYYKGVAQGKALAWQTLIGKTSKKPALVLAVPIKSNGQIVGVLASAMTTDAISKQVANWRKGETGYAFLIDETGKVVAHQVRKYVTAQVNFNSNPLIAEFKRRPTLGAITFTDSEGVNQQGVAKRNKMGWILAVQQAEEEVFEAHERSEKIATYLLVMTLILIVAIALLLARNLVRPIKELTGITTRMSMGELDIDFDIKSKDEIGQLAGAIKLLQTSLSMAMQRLRQKSQRRAA